MTDIQRFTPGDLIPGQFFADGSPNRVDLPFDCKPTLRDKLARTISDNYSGAPGRLCLTKTDYLAADDVMSLLRREGVVPPP